MRISDFTTSDDTAETPEMMDERLQEIVQKSGYKTNNSVRGVLVLAILYKLVTERTVDRTLVAVLSLTLGLDIAYQLYYQYQQGLFPTGD